TTRNERDMGPDLPPGFRWIPGWLDAAEGDALFRRIVAETRWEDPILRVGGRTIAMPRRVAFFGPFAYAYSGVLHPPRPLPPATGEVGRGSGHLAGPPSNAVPATLSGAGAASVPGHSDDDYPPGGHPAVASLGRGATRRFRIAHKRDARARFSLE